MAKTLREIVDALPPERRERVRAGAQKLIAEEMTLQQLRKALGRTQTRLARQIGKPQATISRIEQQSDMLISTLAQVIGALGGRLRLTAELPGMAPVTLAGLRDLGGGMPAAIRSKTSRARERSSAAAARMKRRKAQAV